MTNENAINVLRHLSPPRTSKAAFDAFRQAIEMAIEALKESQSEPHWISVTERLPKENYLDDGYVEPSQPVLVYMSYHTCKISRYWGHRISKGTSDYVIPDWMDLEEYDSDNVIAWRELPEPYKEIEDAE